MLKRTEGIVLRSLPYGEADLIVTYLTPDMGVAKAFAKSPRKTKSRFGSSLEPFTHARVSFLGREDSPMPRLTQSDIITPFQSLREDLRCMMALSETAELTLAMSPEGKPAERVFDLLRGVLGLMAAGGCDRVFALLYKARLLAVKGYAPALSGCARCGREALRYVQSQGGVICGNCGKILRVGADEGIRLSSGSVKLYGALLGWKLERTPRIRASKAMLDELSGVVDSHIEHILTRPLRTRETKAKASPKRLT